MFELEKLLLLLVILALVLAWFEILRARERVVIHCKRLCQLADLQLLDQTVALLSISIRRSDRGGLTFLRKYGFEVSTSGADRMPGIITMKGNRIIESRLEGEDGVNIFHQSGHDSIH